MRYSVGGHLEFVGMQSRQKVSRHVLIPKRLDLLFAVALRLPFGDQRFVDDLNDFHKESPGPGCRIEDLDKHSVGRDALWDLETSVALGHLPPARSVG